MKGENLKHSMILQVTVAILVNFSLKKEFSKIIFFLKILFTKMVKFLPEKNHFSQQVRYKTLKNQYLSH